MSTVFTCENPVRIWNKYTKEFSFVPCRKCSICKSKRAQMWTDKLNRESKCHPYVLFGTLTYRPKYLPYMVYDKEHSALVSKDGTFTISGDDLNEYFDYDSRKYFNLCHGHLPYFRSSDLQAFVKRLRSRVRSNPSGEPISSRYIRYFFCYEFGETKLRPHAHFLIFTGSKWFAEHQKDIIASCWSTDGRRSDSEQLGRIDSEFVKNSASSYVASYLTCTDSLPKIYQFRKLRPASTFSKLPPLGSLLGGNEEVQRLFDSGSVYRSVRGKNGEVLQVLWPKDICDRLYPRVFGFSRVPVDVLRRLYESSGSVVTRSFDEFFWYVKSIIDTGLTDINYQIVRHDDKTIISQNLIDSNLSSYLKWLWTENENVQSNSTLHQMYSTLNRFALQAQNFHVSYADYFNRIVDYWNRRDYALLKYQCEWQQDVSSRSKNLCDFSLMKFDPEFEYQAKNSFNFNLSDYYESDVVDSLSALYLDRDEDRIFLDKVSLCNKIVSDGKNRHIKFEYLENDKIDSELKDMYKYFISKKFV